MGKLRSRFRATAVAVALGIALTGAGIASAYPSIGCGQVNFNNWVHWNNGRYSAWIPNNDWQVVPHDNGIDVTSPIGDAGASIGFSSGNPWGLDADGVAGYVWDGNSISNVQILAKTDPERVAGSERKTFEYTGVSGNYMVQGPVHGILTVDASSYGFSMYSIWAKANVWSQQCPTVKTVLDHMVV